MVATAAIAPELLGFIWPIARAATDLEARILARHPLRKISQVVIDAFEPYR